MRPALLCLCLLLAVSARAQVAAHAPASATNLLRVHPGPWRLPARATLAGMRFDPEGGEAATDLGITASRDEEAAFRARAASLVRTAADGSRHLLLGGALRSWTVATIDDQGRLVQDCVQGEAEARQRIEAAARKRVRK